MGRPDPLARVLGKGGNPAPTGTRGRSPSLSPEASSFRAPSPVNNPAYEAIKAMFEDTGSPLLRGSSGGDSAPRKLTSQDRQYVMAALRPWQQGAYHPNDFLLAHRPSRPDDLKATEKARGPPARLRLLPRTALVLFPPPPARPLAAGPLPHFLARARPPLASLPLPYQ